MNQDSNIFKLEIRRLRNFGITMAVVLSIISSIMLWYDKPNCLYLYIVSGLLLFCAFTFPKLLMPLEWCWMKLAYVLGYIMTRVILTIVYYLAVTPVGLLRQLISRDPLGEKIDKSAESYWEPVDPNGPKSRPYKPY